MDRGSPSFNGLLHSPRDSDGVASGSTTVNNSYRRPSIIDDKLTQENLSRRNQLPEIRINGSTNGLAAHHRRNLSYGQRSSRSGSSDIHETPCDDVIFGYGVNLSSDKMRALFPYHIVVNSDFNVIQMGSFVSSWLRRKYFIRPFDPISKYFRLFDPVQSVTWDWNQIIKWNGQYMELELIAKDVTQTGDSENSYVSSLFPSTTLRLGGEMHNVSIGHSEGAINWQVVFLLAPTIRTKADEQAWKLEIPNFQLRPVQKRVLRLEQEKDDLQRQIAELKQANQRLLQSQEEMKVSVGQSNEEIRNMVTNVAHDLKTPLSAFLSGAESIEHAVMALKRQIVMASSSNSSTPLADGHSYTSTLSHKGNHTPTLTIQASTHVVLPVESVKLQLDNILSDVESMNDINSFMTMTIHRCIDSTKASQGHKLTPKLDTVDLMETLKLPLKCMASMQNRNSKLGISMQCCNPEICSHVITDKQWLQENLLCLLSNASKYSFEGGIAVRLLLYNPPATPGLSVDEIAQTLKEQQQDNHEALLLPTRKQLQSFTSPNFMKQRNSLHRPLSFATTAAHSSSTISVTSATTPSNQVGYPWARLPSDSQYLANPSPYATSIPSIREESEVTSSSVSRVSPSMEHPELVRRNAMVNPIIMNGATNGTLSLQSSPVKSVSTSQYSTPLQTRVRHYSDDFLADDAPSLLSTSMTFDHSTSLPDEPSLLPLHIPSRNSFSSSAKTPVQFHRAVDDFAVRSNNSNNSSGNNTSGRSSSVNTIIPPIMTIPSIASADTEDYDQSLSVSSASERRSRSMSHSGPYNVPSLMNGNASQSPPMLILEVEDEGGGLTEEKMNNLFNPFQQAQKLAGGTGLGLYSLSKRLDALNGAYGVEHRRDGKRGSLFWFAFPYRPDDVTSKAKAIHLHKQSHKLEDLRVEMYNSPTAHADPQAKSFVVLPQANATTAASASGPTPAPLFSEKSLLRMFTRSQSNHFTNTNDTNNSLPVESCSSSSSSNGTDQKKLHVLLVDDTPTIVKMVSQLLLRHGHRVDIAVNGLDALNKITHRFESSKLPMPYDCILMDLNMPVLDGVEATKRIRENEKKGAFPVRQIIIGVSADGDDDTLDTAFEAGIDEFICKPYNLDKFLQTYAMVEHLHPLYQPPSPVLTFGSPRLSPIHQPHQQEVLEDFRTLSTATNSI